MEDPAQSLMPEKFAEAPLSHGGRSIPVIGFGTAASPEATKAAVLEAIRIGYRHIDTALRYGTEEPVGEAVQEAVSTGLVTSREELFIATKLWCPDAHPHLVLPALRKSLGNLKLEYVDLYMIHWPVSSQPGKFDFPIAKEDFLPLDFEGVWAVMEECQKLGLAKTIGVSNFTCNKLAKILATAKIPPAVNQVEVNPFWQQKKLIDFCKANEILVSAYSPLGAIGNFWGSKRILESKILQDIAKSKGKSVPQVCLRWAYEQGIGVVVKSYNKERMRENLQIFDFQLTDEDIEKIKEISQSRGVIGWVYISSLGPIKTAEEMWEGDL